MQQNVLPEQRAATPSARECRHEGPQAHGKERMSGLGSMFGYYFSVLGGCRLVALSVMERLCDPPTEATDPP